MQAKMKRDIISAPRLTCSEFRRICAVIHLAVAYAPPQYPQYKGKIERFFRTARSEMPRAQVPEIATGLHAIWIAEYNHDRIHSRVTDAAGHAQVPAFRLRWKPSAARPLPPDISVDDVFHVQRPHTAPGSRIFKAVREKRCKALYTLAKRSPTALECALVKG